MNILLVLLLLTGCTANYHEYQPLAVLPVNYNQDEINRYLLTQYSNLTIEQSRILYYLSSHLLREDIINGSRNRVVIDGLEIMVECFKIGCDKIVLAHNHPSQYWAHPSPIDLVGYNRFIEMTNNSNILGEYVIISNADTNWIKK
jgi:DNA repair protein RadC